MKMLRLSVLAITSVSLILRTRAQFADAVIEYHPGVGYSAGYTNVAAVLGEPSRATPGSYGGPVDPYNPAWQQGQLLSVGEGGSVTLRMNAPIYTDRTHPFGCDFVVFGNAGFTITNGDYSGGGITDGSMFGNNTGQTRVSVSADGTNFFMLNPALAPTVDTLFPTEGSGDFFLPVNPVLTGGNFAGLGLPGIRALYAGSGGGAGYSLSWAQDADGQPVSVATAQFVRIGVLSGKAEIDAVAAVAPVGGGAVWWENFVTDPAAHGWGIFGDTNLFHWNAVNQNLEVTWDSSHSNSYFQLPLGTLLTRRDDFSVALDLKLNDIAIGVDEDKPGTFQIAFGFMDSANAHQTNFIRGTGSDSPNLVEFNFFPDSGYGPTVWPAVFDTNGVMNYTSSSDFSLFELPVGVPMRFVLSYTASNQTATVSITTNGVLVGPVTSAPLMAGFTQFVLDTFAIASYSDAGQSPFMPGSILAHGTMDNLVVSAQPQPLRNFTGTRVGGNWLGSFTSRTNWNYVLEAAATLGAWTNISPATPGNGRTVTISDTNAALFDQRFYRINATPRF